LILDGVKGMPYIREQRKETIRVEGDWDIGGSTTWKDSTLLQEYAQGLKEKKIIGSLCPGCGKVIVPPRNICGRCHRKMDEKVVVSDIGTITCFVISAPFAKGKMQVLGVDPVEMGLVGEGERVISVYVKLDGADSNIDTELIGVKPEEVYVGMRVKAVWAKERQGKLSDLEAVEPLRD